MITFNGDGANLTMEGSTKVIIKASQTIVGTGTQLPIEIVGEFKDIPPHLHQLYIQSMWASYGNVNVYNNTDEEPKTIKEQKSEWRINKLAKLLMKAVTK